jgi:hypothetical protein
MNFCAVDPATELVNVTESKATGALLATGAVTAPPPVWPVRRAPFPSETTPFVLDATLLPAFALIAAARFAAD